MIKTAQLLFAAFVMATGYRLTLPGRIGVRQALVRCAAALALYWLLFVPTLAAQRYMGLSDIGRMTILREAFFLGDSVLPFAPYIGGYVLCLLLYMLLTRLTPVHPAFSAWLYIVMPATVSQVLIFYFPANPNVVTALSSLQLGVCAMGTGCLLAQWTDICRGGRRKPGGMMLAAAALAGHYLLPEATFGAMQLLGNRVSFTLNLDMIYLPVMAVGASGAQIKWKHAEETPRPSPYFDRETTLALKGTAIVLMFVHHFFTLPTWYVDGIAYPSLAGFADLFQYPLAVCVPVFAFITGYFYAFSSKTTLRDSLSRIWGVLRVYWPIQAALFAAAAVCGAQVNLRGFLWELVGLENSVMLFNWYIAFYIMIMLLLPVLTRLPVRSPLGVVLVLIGIPVLGATAVRALAVGAPHLQLAGQYMLDGIAGLGAGYAAARFGWFENGLDRLLGRKKGPRLCACAALMILAMLGRKYAPRLVVQLPLCSQAWALRISMDMVYAPVCVYALANLLPLLPRLLWRALCAMGRYSLHMWLISCVFFGVSKAVFQPVLYAPGHPVLVTLWGLLLCYAPARLFDLSARLLKKRRAADGKLIH